MSRIFLGVPTYDHRIMYETATTIFKSLKSPSSHEIMVKKRNSSLLPQAFNQLWCEAINRKSDYFAMIHSDIAAEPGWLSILIDELTSSNADVMASHIPIKDDRGVSSTAIMEDGECIGHVPTILPPGVPQTFCEWEGKPVGMNTGLWVAKLGEWSPKVHFEIKSWLGERDGIWGSGVLSEDWNFSEMARQLGVRVYVTAKVSVCHFGPQQWTNRSNDDAERAINLT